MRQVGIAVPIFQMGKLITIGWTTTSCSKTQGSRRSLWGFLWSLPNIVLSGIALPTEWVAGSAGNRESTKDQDFLYLLQSSVVPPALPCFLEVYLPPYHTAQGPFLRRELPLMDGLRRKGNIANITFPCCNLHRRGGDCLLSPTVTSSGAPIL